MLAGPEAGKASYARQHDFGVHETSIVFEDAGDSFLYQKMFDLVLCRFQGPNLDKPLMQGGKVVEGTEVRERRRVVTGDDLMREQLKALRASDQRTADVYRRELSERPFCFLDDEFWCCSWL